MGHGSYGRVGLRTFDLTPRGENLLKMDVERERCELKRAARADQADAGLLPQDEVGKAALRLNDALGPTRRT